MGWVEIVPSPNAGQHGVMRIMSIAEILFALVAVAILAVPISQAFWIPLTHLRYTLYQRRQESPTPPLGFRGSLAYYWRALVANVVMAWWTLRALGRNGLRQPAGKISGPPVLCIHGFLRNGTCMWGLRRALERRGRPTRAVSMGRPLRSIDGYTPPLEAVLRQLAGAYPGQKIDIVAHSMGGIVLRRVLARHPDLAPAVCRIVTLGSPHRGTAAIRRAWGAPESRQLGRGAEFLIRLPDFHTSAPGARVITVAAEHDFIVYPESTSHLPGTQAVNIPNTSHPGLLTEAQVIAQVVDVLVTPTER